MNAIRIALVLVAAAPALAQEKVKFEPKFVVNTAFYQQVSTTVTQTIKVTGGSEIVLSHAQTFNFKWLPTKQDGDKWTVELTIEGMKLNIDVASNVVKYDSSAPPDGGNNPVLADFFKKLTGTKFTVTIGKGGVIEKVDGRDEFIKNLGGAASQQMEGILKKILADEALKEMADPMAGLTAAGDKAVNEGWERKATVPLGPIGSYARTLKFNYKSKEAATDIHRVEVTVDMTYAPPAAADAGDGLLFRVKKGELTPQKVDAGFYRFDAKAGYVKEAEVTVTLQGKLTIALGNNTETEVGVFQTQKTKLETKDTSFNVQAGPVPGPGVPPIPPKQ